MNKTLVINGKKTLCDVQCHKEKVYEKKWTKIVKTYSSVIPIECKEVKYKMYYRIGGYHFTTTWKIRFGTRVTEIWEAASGKNVYSEKKCLESFINAYYK